MSKEKILHLFERDIQYIIDNLDNIKASGWDSILTSPIQPSKEGNEWWTNYQVLNLSIGNKYGTKEQLTKLCESAHAKGLKIYLDLIVTHFANIGGGDKQFIPHEKVDRNLVNNEYFWREKKMIDYEDRYSITHHCNGLPAIRLDNCDYQDLVSNFINSLVDCQIDGIRLDSAKMISVPEEDFGEARNMFFDRVFNNSNKPTYVFGEVIFEKQSMIEKYQKYIDVLTEFSGNSYNLNKEHTVFFQESHDSYNDRNLGYTRSWSVDRVIDGYETLVRDFQKVLFYARPKDDSWKSDRIKQINNTYK